MSPEELYEQLQELLDQDIFSTHDTDFARSLCEYFEDKGTLTQKQIEAGQELMKGYENDEW